MNTQFVSSVNLPASNVLKANSANYKCAVVDDTNTANTLNTYDFTASTATSRPVTAALFSGITLSDAGTKFDVSDNCNGLRINNKILHWSTSAYFADDLPTGITTLGNPAFSEDFSFVAVDNAIYTYTPKNGATAGFYTVRRNDSFFTDKKIWK